MENEKSGRPSLEELMEQKKEIEKQIIDLDATGQKGEALNELHAKHAALTIQIENTPNPDEMDDVAKWS